MYNRVIWYVYTSQNDVTIQSYYNTIDYIPYAVYYIPMTTNISDANDFFPQIKHGLVERKLILLGGSPYYNDLN